MGGFAGSAASRGQTTSDGKGVRWTYAVHEQILPALRRANVPVHWTDLTVRHTGYTDLALRERKLQRDGKILDAELAEQPDDPFMLFNPGSVAVERQNWPAALAYHQRSLRGSASSDSIVRKLFALIARCQVSQTRDSDGEKLPSPRPVRPIQRRQGAFRERPQGGRGRP